MCCCVTASHVQVDELLGDRKPTIEDIKALRFTTRVINEAMRLYPQPPVLIRRALEDDILGGYEVHSTGSVEALPLRPASLLLTDLLL